MFNILFWPFRLLWSLISFLFQMTGRLIGAVTAFLLLIVGLVLTITVAGAIIGIPLMITGFLLLVRALF